MNAEQLRTELIAVLDAASGPLTTTAARAAVTARPGTRGPVVAEQVYRALLVLQRRGVVRRVHDRPGRLARWELAVLLGDTAAVSGGCGQRGGAR